MSGFKKTIVTLLVAILMFSTFIISALAVENSSTIDPNEFKEPGIDYRPGVRWWLPGGAITEDEMVREVNLLAENGFGYAEINPFAQDAENNPELKAGYETVNYYNALEAAVEAASEVGLTIDLNMGSGWNANDSDVPIEESMGNMVIGRTSLTVDIPQIGNNIDVDIPNIQQTQTYNSTDETDWDETLAKIQGVLIGKIVDVDSTVLANGNGAIDSDLDQYVLDTTTLVYFDLSDSSPTPATVSWTPSSDGEYAVIATYFIPAGTRGIHSVNADDGYVVDHMNAQYVTEYMEEWMGSSTPINGIVNKYPDTVRSYFNDSYEFYGDTYFNELLYEMAKDENSILGYDFSPYLGMIFKPGSALPFYYAFFGDTRMAADTLYCGTDSGAKNPDVQSRILYDYKQLANLLWMDGLEAFQAVSNKYGGEYRQQAYNTPLDELGAGKYVDIPEQEQGNESNLKSASSAAHLYDRDLSTAEQFTLGNTPYKENMTTIKSTFDLMATSGINNFFYHGFNYKYFGTEAMQADYTYGETGWNAFFGIGINVGEQNSLWPYYKKLNQYASRANYVMQQGAPSADVALYTPQFDRISVGDGASVLLNQNGYAWDAINNESILAATYADGVIKSGYSDTTYKAIVVEDTTVPVETMQKLKDLADQGATVIFYGTDLPSRQPSFLNGAYAAGDTLLTALANDVVAVSTGSQATDESELVSQLANARGRIYYTSNANARYARRTLDNGGELAYISNIASSANEITIKIQAGEFANYYWLDQDTGNIYEADVDGNTVSVELPAHGAIVLLCEPDGYVIDVSDIANGQPLSINVVDLLTEDADIIIDTFDLSVTADNIGTSTKGTMTTASYDNISLGNWITDGYLDGDLKYVDDPGTYTSNFIAGALTEEHYYLDLGSVYNVVEVTVNGEYVDTLTHAPYVVDITNAVVEGENTLSLKITGPTNNRYFGFGAAYTETSEDEYSFYSSYAATGGRSAPSLADAGLIGPVEIYASDIIEYPIDASDDQEDPGTVPTPTPSATTPADDRTIDITGTAVGGDNEPYEGATVELHSTPQIVVTDSAGEFSFTDVEVEDHTLIIKDASGTTLQTYTLSLAEGSGFTWSQSGDAISVALGDSTAALEITMSISDSGEVKVLDIEAVENPETGDASGIWWMLFVLPVVVCGAVFLVRRKQKQVSES